MLEISVNGSQQVFDLDNPKLPDWVEDYAFSSGGYPSAKKMKRSDYEKELEALQLELVKLQADRLETGTRIVILFEGRDAAGKGGTIGAFREYLKPRNARVVALSKPTEMEQGQLYYQRYAAHLPTAGDMTLYDRSWYNRGGVEPVMGFCSPEQHKTFLKNTPPFEKMLIDDGVKFFKFWLNVGQEMQIKRFHDRRHNPLKSWKLSPIDIKALTKFDEYTTARDSMLEATHTEHAPWTIIRSNDKRRARLNAIRCVLNALDYSNKKAEVIGQLDPKIIGSGPAFLNAQGA